MRALPLIAMLSLIACGATSDETEDTGTVEEAACADGETRETADACGFNGLGVLTEICSAGAFAEDSCDDPDECTNDEVGAADCWDGRGSIDTLCVEGGPVEQGDCSLVEAERVSVSSAGVPGNGHSDGAVISANGRFVVFSSTASNLVTGDDNGVLDVFLHDLETQTTELISVNRGGTISANGNSRNGRVSGDGRYVLFTSSATDLIAGEGITTVEQGYLRDRQAGTTILISGTTDQIYSLDISADASTIAFSTRDALLGADEDINADIYRAEIDGTLIDFVPVPVGDANNPRLSADGSAMTFSAYTNARGGLPGSAWFWKEGGTAERMSISMTGDNRPSSSATISGDGSTAVFSATSNDFVEGDSNGQYDAFSWDTSTGDIGRVSLWGDGSEHPQRAWGGSFSHDGTVIAFEMYEDIGARAVDATVNNVYLKDLVSGDLSLLSTNASGEQPNGGSFRPSLDGAGRQVAFDSDATDIVSGDTEGYTDIFVLPTR